MLAALTLVAILIICTFIVVFWMSKAPRIEEDGEKEIESRVSALAEDDTRLQQVHGERTQQKAKGA